MFPLQSGQIANNHTQTHPPNPCRKRSHPIELTRYRYISLCTAPLASKTARNIKVELIVACCPPILISTDSKFIQAKHFVGAKLSQRKGERCYHSHSSVLGSLWVPETTWIRHSAGCCTAASNIDTSMDTKLTTRPFHFRKLHIKYTQPSRRFRLPSALQVSICAHIHLFDSYGTAKLVILSLVDLYCSLVVIVLMCRFFGYRIQRT